jgi:hypothetical protein
MRLESPENFSENGARPVQILGPRGRLIGWARSFSDFMSVTDNTIMGDRPAWRLTRIAGRDVRVPDGHTVGKTFHRKALWRTPTQPSPARSAVSASNHPAALPLNSFPSVERGGLLRHRIPDVQNGTRESGLGQAPPGFLRSNVLSRSPEGRLRAPISSPLRIMLKENQPKS